MMDGFNKGGIAGILSAVLKGVAFFAICVLLFSAVFFLFTVNESYIPICYNGLVFLTAFFVGIWSSKNQSTKGYLRGLFGGLAFTLLFMVFSSLYGGKPVTHAAVTYFIMIIISICGGIIGINVN